MDELEERIFKAIWQKTSLFPSHQRQQVLDASLIAAEVARNYFEPMVEVAVDAIVRYPKQLGDRRLT